MQLTALQQDYSAAPSGADDLVRQMMQNIERKRQINRQQEMDRLNEQDRQREIATAAEDRAIKIAQLQQTIAGQTDLTQAPQVEKQVTEGFNVNPEEAAYAGVAPGFTPTGEVTTSVPDVPRSTKLTVGGQELDIPLKYKQDIEAQKQADFDVGLEQLGRTEEVKSRYKEVMVPNDPRYGASAGQYFAPAVASAIIKAANAATKRIERTVDLGNQTEYIYTDGTSEMKPRGAPPSSTSPDTDGGYVTNKQGQRVWVSKAEQRAAPVGTYSDVRPTITSVRKADPAKLKMAYKALGNATTPNSLWSLAVEINKDPGMLAGLKAVGKKKMVDLSGELASRSEDPQVKKMWLYTTALQGFASSIAKAFGESGVLTNQDIARATGLFPKVGESPDTTLIKLNRIMAVMEAGLDRAGFAEITGREPCIPGAGCPEGGGEGADDSAAPAGPTPPPGFRIKGNP